MAKLNDLTESTNVSDTDILHLRTNGGVDQKITGENLRESVVNKILTLNSTQTINLSVYTTDLTVVTTNTADITLTFTNALSSGKTLKVLNGGGNNVSITVTSSSFAVNPGTSTEFTSNGTSMYNSNTLDNQTFEVLTITTGTYNDLDLTNYSSLKCDTGLGDITINGVIMRNTSVISIAKTTAANNLIFNHNSGSAVTQAVFTEDARQVVITGNIIATLYHNVGGATFLNQDSGTRFPIGYIYTQLRGELAPSGMGFQGTWTNVSSSHAGNFFRAEGGSAPTFGNTQSDTLQGHHHVSRIGTTVSSGDKISIGASDIAFTTNTADSSSFQVAEAATDATYGTIRVSSETRPVNEAVRIWERTA